MTVGMAGQSQTLVGLAGEEEEEGMNAGGERANAGGQETGSGGV